MRRAKRLSGKWRRKTLRRKTEASADADNKRDGEPLILRLPIMLNQMLVLTIKGQIAFCARSGNPMPLCPQPIRRAISSHISIRWDGSVG